MPRARTSWLRGAKVWLYRGGALAVVGLLGCLPDRFTDGELDQKVATATQLGSCRTQASCALAPGCATDQACRAACSAGAADAVVARVNAVVECRAACVSKNCAGATGSALSGCENNCLADQCAGESLACAAPTATGAGACSDMLPCVTNCAMPVVTDSLSCLATCTDALASAELGVATAVTSCLSASGKAGTKSSDACINEFAACYAGGVSGSALCHESFACLEGCAKTGKSDEACIRECMAKLTTTAQTQLVSCLECLGDNNNIISACKLSIIACADPKGTSPCAKMFEQTTKCIKINGTAASGSCIATSLHGGKPQAAIPYIDLLACYNAECGQVCDKSPSECTTCLATKCGTKQGACTG